MSKDRRNISFHTDIFDSMGVVKLTVTGLVDHLHISARASTQVAHTQYSPVCPSQLIFRKLIMRKERCENKACSFYGRVA